MGDHALVSSRITKEIRTTDIELLDTATLFYFTARKHIHLLPSHKVPRL